MDGRIQTPIAEYLARHYHVEYVDVITEPGPIKYLDENENYAVLESIKKRVKISVEVHKSKVIAISGHFDCAGNPVDKKRQLRQIKGSARLVKKWNHGVKIIRLWVEENWKIKKF
jgi:hypothetical protein